MATKIITIEYEIPGFSADRFGYSADQSLLDADIVFFEPRSFVGVYEYGLPWIDEDNSEKLKRQTEHWKSEILTALGAGKTVFVVLKKHETVSIHTGRKDFKGSRVINHTEPYSNFNFLPPGISSIVPKSGQELVFKQHPAFKTFWNDFKNKLRYEAYLDEKVTEPIFVTKTGEKALGAVFKIGSGHLVLLPVIGYDRKTFVKQNKKGRLVWTNEALRFGQKLVSNLEQIDKALKSSNSQTPPPTWVQGIKLTEEKRFEEEVSRLDDEIRGRVEKRDDFKVRLEEARLPKGLLFETGKSLERAVTQALRVLGYVAEGHDDGLLEFDQVIISPEGDRFLGECEGKDASAINIDKFRQLSENIQSDFEREEISEQATGILFGNGFRLSPPETRPEQFTAKCLASAKRGAILIRTCDLFPVISYLLDSEDKRYALACRNAIKSSVGGVVLFPLPPK